MFDIALCTRALFISGVAFANGLTIPTEGSLSNTPAPLINITIPPDANSATPSNDLQIQCRGSQYGSHLSYTSCLDAFSTFPHGGAVNLVQIRRRGGPGLAAHKLPWRWISGDGRCTFDFVMRGRAAAETTTGVDIARAAWKLMNECVRDQGGQGGVLSGLGRTGTLGIIIRSHKPANIQCGTIPQTYDSSKCDDLLNELPADQAPEKTWGPPRQRGVDIPTPHVWDMSRPDDKCRMVVASINAMATDQMTLYDMWQTGVMIAGMCVRFGKAGRVDKLGVNRKLWIFVDDGSAPIGALGSVPSGSSLAANTTVLTFDRGVGDGWDMVTATAKDAYTTCNAVVAVAVPDGNVNNRSLKKEELGYAMKISQSIFGAL